MAQRKRDVERNVSCREFTRRLRRLADLLESGRPVRIQVAGERVRIPARARLSIEHERDETHEEIEFQITWTVARRTRGRSRPQGRYSRRRSQ